MRSFVINFELSNPSGVSSKKKFAFKGEKKTFILNPSMCYETQLTTSHLLPFFFESSG